MSASQSQALDAIALQLVVTLERYDVATSAMLVDWPDLDGYRAVSDGIEAVRLYSSSLPEVRVQWAELLIAHAELVHVLWRGQYGGGGAPEDQVAAVRDRHMDCISALRNRCLRIVARSAGDCATG
jgi:hypothetical protein